jgi:predicted TIM-barrel fold metal-dependent hydrolase
LRICERRERTTSQLRLFDANGSFGNPAISAPDCPTAAVRLAHMDRLGIARSLAWNVEATQSNPLAANRRLLDEIAHTPGAAGRLVPALAVSGLAVYEINGIERFVAQMEEGRTRALRFVNVGGRLSLEQCAPVMQAVRRLGPFILVKWGETPARDILDFAALFPDVPLVLTDLIWPCAIGAFDVMRQRPNVLMETSWWHTWEGVALAVKHFGAERVLFGTGYRSHNSAAIAALARAEISEPQRDLIAHGNLDRLTGSATEERVAARASSANRLWQRCLAGEPLGVDIVDAHAHLGPSAGYVLAHQDERAQIPAVLRVMDKLGQRTMIFSGLQALHGSPADGNDLVRDLIKPHAGRLAMYAAFNPFYAADLLPRLDGWFADPQVVGFKLLCDYWQVPVTDARFEPMWEYADRHRLPVLMHSWNGKMDSPAMARGIVSRHRDLSLLLGHSGGGDEGRSEAEALALEFPNVFLETCGSFCTTRRWEDTLKIVPVEKVVYGTDAAAHDIHWELGRILSLDVSEDVLVPILGQNMRRILARRQ